MNRIATSVLLLISTCCDIPADSVEVADHRSTSSFEWQTQELSAPTTTTVYLSGLGQLAVETERGGVTIRKGNTYYARNAYGRVVLSGLRAGAYVVAFNGSSGRAVIEPDVYGKEVTRQVSDGVTWTRFIDRNPATSINLLRIDVDRLQDVDVWDDDQFCRSVPVMGRRAGATAGINGTFWSKDGAKCVQDHGAIRYGQFHAGNFGGQVPAMSLPSGDIDMVSHILDAPGPSAITGSPPLVPIVGYDNGSKHPRTVLGRFADGSIGMLTIDGRTTVGTSVTTTEAAQIASQMGMVEAINMDGGGSTTMWIHGATLSGVVNYPSDWWVIGYPDHNRARQVSDAIFVW